MIRAAWASGLTFAAMAALAFTLATSGGCGDDDTDPPDEVIVDAGCDDPVETDGGTNTDGGTDGGTTVLGGHRVRCGALQRGWHAGHHVWHRGRRESGRGPGHHGSREPLWGMSRDGTDRLVLFGARRAMGIARMWIASWCG